MTTAAPRIEPLRPPYEPDVAEHLARAMPAWAKMEPLALFRTWARHLPLARALRPLGRHVLAEGALAPWDRELLILRTCALCGAEYEWGVHVVSYPPRLGIPEEKVRATRSARPDDPLWEPRESLLLRVADALHETATLDDGLWEEAARVWSEAELLELLVVAGFYHAVSFTVNALRLPPEPWAARFPARGAAGEPTRPSSRE